MSLDEPEPVDSVLTFLSVYDTLEYSWAKVTAVSVHLQILFVTLQNTNNGEPEEAEGHAAGYDLGQMLRDKEVCETEKESRDLKRMLEDYITLLYQIANKATRSWVPHWNCCNGRHHIVCLTRDSRSC